MKIFELFSKPVNKIAWDFDETLVESPASETLQEFIKTHPEIEHYIITARSGSYLVGSMMPELAQYPAKLNASNFTKIITSDHAKHTEYQQARAARKSGQLTGPLIPIEIYEFTIKGKLCHELGIPVLVDDNIPRSKMGCDKYGIKMVLPLDCI